VFRGRRQERREERAATQYQMRQRMISIGDGYVIGNDRGERVYRLDGQALRIRQAIVFEDIDGRELYKIQEPMLRVRDSMQTGGPDGNRAAMVGKAMVTPLRERWVISLDGGPGLHARGNIAGHQYAIERGGDQAAEISRRWFRVRDTYRVEVMPGENDILILAATAVIDTMAHPGR
jgi:uncharacterized protein YxjI